MLRLCVITNTIDLGGAETQLLRLAGALDPAEVRMTLVYYGGRGDLAPEFRQRPIELVHLDRDAIGRVRFVRDLSRFLRDESFDVVHCWRGTANHYGVVAAILARCPCILTGHRDYEVASLATRLIDRALLPFVKRRVVNSAAIREKHGRTSWLPAAHLSVLYNGLDPREFEGDESAQAIRASLGLDPEPPLLVHIGRLDEPKRQMAFLRLASTLLAEGRRVQFALVGQGPDRERLADHVRQEGLEGHVHLLGARRDVPRILSAATLNVCTSFSEGLPNVVLESMMAGTAVVTVDNGGGPELLESAEQVVPVDDPDALARVARRALDEPETRAEWERKARERARANFTLDVAARRYATLLHEVAGRPVEAESGASPSTEVGQA